MRGKGKMHAFLSIVHGRKKLPDSAAVLTHSTLKWRVFVMAGDLLPIQYAHATAAVSTVRIECVGAR